MASDIVKRVLITGGSGFVGFHLATALAFRGESEITLADDLSRGPRDNQIEELLQSSRVRLLELDLADPASFAKLGGGYDEVYHLAAVIGVRNVLERPWDVVRINALATLYLLEWFRAGGAKKFLFSSTSEAYAWTRLFHDIPVPTPEDVPLAITDVRLPRSSYAGSKIFGELAVSHACAGLPHVIVRYHNVYGPRMGWQHVVPEIMMRLEQGENPLRVFSPTHTRAFCYVDDAVRATIACMESPEADGGTFNIGNDLEELPVRELVKKIMQAVGRVVPTVEVEAAHDPITRRCPDVSLLRRKLGYEPRDFLDVGLQKTAEWYLPRIPSSDPRVVR
jgi:nucleoside-diphosphate-sugar epimerase